MHKFLCNRQHIPKHVQNYLPTHSSKRMVNFHKSPVTFPQLFFSWLVRVTEDFFSFQHFSIWYYTKAGCCLHIGLVYAIHYKVQKWHDRKEKKSFLMSNLKKKMWAANPTAIFIRQLSWLLLWSGHKLGLPAVSWWAQGFGSPHISSAIDSYTSALIVPMVQLKKPSHGKQLLCLNHLSLKHHCQGAAKHCWGKVCVRILPDGFVQKWIIK